MIGVDAYFGQYANSPDAGPGMWAAADDLLDKVGRLLEDAAREGVELHVNPTTKSQIAGSGNGGFRPAACPVGAPNSAHKQGRAVDVYDPLNQLDDWLDDELLAEHSLYREAPAATLGWVHLTTRPPHSGKRTFNP